MAASEIFAIKGVNAATSEVAEAAGVGIGTVFRHFPTKESLLKAVLIERLERIAIDAEERARSGDPGEAFTEFFRHVVSESASKVAIVDALRQSGVDVMNSTSPVVDHVRRSIAALLTRAQEAGSIRDDVDVDDIIALLAGTTQAAQLLGLDHAARDRTLDVVLSGLRPPVRPSERLSGNPSTVGT